MHAEAYAWVAEHAKPSKRVLDIGGRDINGTPRALFPFAEYTVIDLEPGVNVNVVADVTQWETEDRFDTVLCLEVLEHVEKWPLILDAAHRLCTGTLIVTCAGPGRAPHSAYDGGPVGPDEWYANVDPGELWHALRAWQHVQVDVLGTDVRAVASP